MALEIQNETIVGKINDIHSMNGIGLHDNLQEKLNGKLPVDRVELLYLINSWGRISSFDTNDNIKITKCKSKECYDLSKLDTSEITDMSQLFYYSEFNGDISNWDVSNVTNMNMMFYNAESFNQPLNNWDVSNVTNMRAMFCLAKEFNQNLNNWDVSNVTQMSEMFQQASNFNQPLNNWNVSNVTNMGYMFYNAKSFKEKYNSGEPLPTNTNDIKDWFNLNRDRMNDLDLKDKHGEEVDNFFSNILLTECNKLCL